MPRKAIGPRPLTPAERQAHQREKKKHELDRLRRIEQAALAWRDAQDAKAFDQLAKALAKREAR